MIGDWSFLKSRRFWALVAIGVVKALEAVGVINSVIADSLITILGGFIGIRTIDKFSESIAKSRDADNGDDTGEFFVADR